MKKNTNYSKEDEIRLNKIIEALDSDIKRLKVRRKNYKKQLILPASDCGNEFKYKKAFNIAIKYINTTVSSMEQSKENDELFRELKDIINKYKLL
jgi:hypothetical protein